LQAYDYTGSAAATYTIDFAITGDFFLAASDPASLMQIYGGLTVFGPGFDPLSEIKPILDFEYVGDEPTDPGATPFSLAGSVSFDVNPGDNFYVWANLLASADSSHEIMGYVDAMNTLSMQFTSGDTSLLTARTPAPATVVPEPGTWLLTLSGLALLGRAKMRRHKPVC
jgi:hypothetical protein